MPVNLVTWNLSGPKWTRSTHQSQQNGWGRKPNLTKRSGRCVRLPAGFLSATYRAGDQRQIVLRFEIAHLPDTWTIHACGRHGGILLDSNTWVAGGQKSPATLSWEPVQPPERLLVRWAEGEAFWSLNVEDARQLPPPAELEDMTADDMLLVPAASDPSAAFRAWAKRRRGGTEFDDELDSALPTDLDPCDGTTYELRFCIASAVVPGSLPNCGKICNVQCGAFRLSSGGLKVSLVSSHSRIACYGTLVRRTARWTSRS